MKDSLRTFIQMAEALRSDPEPTVLLEDFESQPAVKSRLDPLMESQLKDLMFKLTSYQDPDSGEYAAGRESGMAMAADLLLTTITKLRGE